MSQAVRYDVNGGVGRRWWRSNTFSDGTRAITLVVRVDPMVAGALRARAQELIVHGCDRLIVDATAARPSGAEERLLLAGALAGHPASCRIAVVVPSWVAAGDAFPAAVTVARTLTEARTLVGSGRARQIGRSGPAPALPLRERHALAVRQSLRWATLAAAAGDYEDALSLLATVEAVEGVVPPDWQARRDAWSLACNHRRGVIR